jgi:hypothetical protein
MDSNRAAALLDAVRTARSGRHRAVDEFYLEEAVQELRTGVSAAIVEASPADWLGTGAGAARRSRPRIAPILRREVASRRAATLANALVMLRSDADSHCLRGCALLSAGELRAALGGFEEARCMTADRVLLAIVELNRGACFDRLGQRDEARARFTAARDSGVRRVHVPASLFAAMAAYEVGRSRLARDHVRELARARCDIRSDEVLHTLGFLERRVAVKPELASSFVLLSRDLEREDVV